MVELRAGRPGLGTGARARANEVFAGQLQSKKVSKSPKPRDPGSSGVWGFNSGRFGIYFRGCLCDSVLEAAGIAARSAFRLDVRVRELVLVGAALASLWSASLTRAGV